MEAVHDQLVDIAVYGRFFDFMIRLNGLWRIQNREPIYDKDTIQAVEPGVTLHLDPDVLAKQPIGFRHLAYVQAAGGLDIVTTIPDPNSEQMKLLYLKGQRWLNL